MTEIWNFIRKVATGNGAFRYDPNGALAAGHQMLDDYLAQTTAGGYRLFDRANGPNEFEAGRAILSAEPERQVLVVRSAMERLAWMEQQPESLTMGSHHVGSYLARQWISRLLDRLMARQLPVSEEDLLHLLEQAAVAIDAYRASDPRRGFAPILPLARLLSLVERHVETTGLSSAVAGFLQRLRPLEQQAPLSGDPRKLAQRIDDLLGQSAPILPDSGEPWADAITADLASMTPRERGRWEALLKYAATADGTRPSGRWLRDARSHLEAVGKETFRHGIGRWFPLVALPRADQRERPNEWSPNPALLISDRSADILKGLAWCCLGAEDPALNPVLGDLAEDCFKKVTWLGPRCPRVGNACVHALSAMPGTAAVAQLSRLKVRVEHPSALKQIEKALETAASRAGVTPEDLEEMAVPTCGLGADGSYRRQIGRFAAEVRVQGASRVEVSWFDGGGQGRKSVPAEATCEHAEELKTLRQDAADLQKTLGAQRDRLERLLASEREWALGEWKERLPDHPLLAPIARRLIWHFRDGTRVATGIRSGNQIVDASDSPLPWLTQETHVRLWHPVGFEPEEVLRWRVWLEEHGVTQPFKQAHRELYILTDAELGTGTYSNRFAAHILKQHQFRALCDQRGWSYRLQGGFDSGDAPAAARPLPQWSLRAEFWVEPLGDRAAMSGAGICLYVATDQVRFYRLDERDPLPLMEVPALVFSEVMRDVDLFVSVCSIAADPAWHDRGAEQYQGYWQSYAFGDLPATAKTRRKVLERLLPRLKIRDRCTLDSRFLLVRGDLRTYKIHLGSGNILMEPNGQYLCIVPNRSTAMGDGGNLFLPFEGDQTFSIILSKAFLLAEDAKITDPSITSQIRR